MSLSSSSVRAAVVGGLGLVLAGGVVALSVARARERREHGADYERHMAGLAAMAARRQKKKSGGGRAGGGKDQKGHQYLETFRARPTDVFICTLMKSGTTWMQQIIHHGRTMD